MPQLIRVFEPSFKIPTYELTAYEANEIKLNHYEEDSILNTEGKVNYEQDQYSEAKLSALPHIPFLTNQEHLYYEKFVRVYYQNKDNFDAKNLSLKVSFVPEDRDLNCFSECQKSGNCKNLAHQQNSLEEIDTNDVCLRGSFNYGKFKNRSDGFLDFIILTVNTFTLLYSEIRDIQCCSSH